MPKNNDINFFNEQNHRLNLIRNMPNDHNKQRSLVDFIDFEESRLRRLGHCVMQSPWLTRANRLLSELEEKLYDEYLNDDDSVRRMLF